MDAIEEISNLFKEYGRTLGSVESYTGGLFASKITSIPGASHFFKGSLVTYATEEKNRLLSIPYADLDKNGVVSNETAATMAGRGAKLLNVDYCISFTGNAGPSTMEGKPVGQVHIAVNAYDACFSFEFHFEGTRSEIQEQSIIVGCELLKNILIEKK